MAPNNHRTTSEVIEEHLGLRQVGDVETDLERNFDEDVVLLTMEGEYHGHDGVRKNAQKLADYFGPVQFLFPVLRIYDRFAFLEWRVEKGGNRTCDGADSFVVENDKIVCQTIRYTVFETHFAAS